MTVLTDDLIPLDQWNQLLADSRHSSPFQTQEFYSLCNSVPGFRAKAVAVCDNECILALAVVAVQYEHGIKSLLTRRGIVYGGPLVKEGSEEALDMLLVELYKLLRRSVIYLESRNYADYSAYGRHFIKNQWSFVPYLNLTIDIEGRTFTEILSGMNYNRRRQINMSLERGAFYRECKSETELKAVYDILADFYSDKLKLPLPGMKFFEALWLNNPGKVFVVLHEERVIGGSFCLALPGRSIYTMYYCGLRDYDRKIYPTHLAVCAAIDYAVTAGLKVFAFMGAGLKDEEYGVRTYKQEFGSQMNEFGRYLRVTNHTLYFIGKTGLKLQRLGR